MGFITGIAKYLLFFFNLLIVVCGIALITIGAIILVNERKGNYNFTSDNSVGGLGIVVGVIIFIIAFFGCCGAIKENSCMLLTYAIILIVLFVLQVILGALAFVALHKYVNTLDDEFEELSKEIFDKYGSDTDVKKIIDDIQQEFECCGVKGPSYWVNIPDSCFPNNDRTQRMYSKGCAYKYQAYIKSSIEMIAGVALGFAAVELVAAIFAFCVRNKS